MEKKTPIVVPVLVIGFNRPDILRQCIAKLRESKPQNMYFACDGARADKEGEDARNKGSPLRYGERYRLALREALPLQRKK